MLHSLIAYAGHLKALALMLALWGWLKHKDREG
jgi:hypothetical protein